jgi:MOSC domain-containing protein YiiM
MSSTSPHVTSVQVGREQALPWRGAEVATAIVKTPVPGSVAAHTDGLEGDEQVDRPIHGGPDKAICCYPGEHYARWARLIGREPDPGGFGENLTLAGVSERDVRIGEVFDIGTARVQVSQPRAPCFKLAMRWDCKELPAMMASEGTSGWHLRVLHEGVITAGDELRPVETGDGATVAEVMRVTYGDGRDDAEAIRRVLALDELAEAWYEALTYMSRARGIALSGA